MDRHISLKFAIHLALQKSQRPGHDEIVCSKSVPTNVKFFMDTFLVAIKKHHWYLLLERHRLTTDPVWERTSIVSLDEFEICAPASETKIVNIDLDPSQYIKSLE